MSATRRLQYFIVVIAVCSRPSLSRGSPWHEVKVVTYGEPCRAPRYLPVRIEEPARPVEEELTQRQEVYQPLKLNYQTVFKPVPQPQYLQREYPVAIEVPEIVSPPEEVLTYPVLPLKSYEYGVQIPPPTERVSINRNYNFDARVLPPKITPDVTLPEEPITLLTGLTGRIDRILVPACDEPSCNCNIY